MFLLNNILIIFKFVQEFLGIKRNDAAICMVTLFKHHYTMVRTSSKTTRGYRRKRRALQLPKSIITNLYLLLQN